MGCAPSQNSNTVSPTQAQKGEHSSPTADTNNEPTCAVDDQRSDDCPFSADALEAIALRMLEANSRGVTQGKTTFACDSHLPKLPLPTIQETMTSLKASVMALPQARADADAVAAFDKAVAEATEDEGLKQAHQLLEERHATLCHYMGDWWEQYAYLSNRSPSYLATNVFAVRDSDFDKKTGKPAPPIPNQIQRAALCIVENIVLMRLLTKQQVPPDCYGRKGLPLCMEQYRRFWSVRIPGIQQDTMAPNEDYTKLRHAHVMYKGASFLLPLYRSEAGGYEDLRSFTDFCASIADGVRTIDTKYGAQGPPLSQCVGALTCGGRTEWAQAWIDLEAHNADNAAWLKIITEGCLASVCLDDPTVEDGAIMKAQESVRGSMEYAAWRHPVNRWYDRSRTQIVLPNGVVLENGDHTAMDAVVMTGVPFDLMTGAIQELVKDGVDLPPLPDLTDSSSTTSSSTSSFSLVDWSVPDAVSRAIEVALAEHHRRTTGRVVSPPSPASDDTTSTNDAGHEGTIGQKQEDTTTSAPQEAPLMQVDTFTFPGYGKDVLKAGGVNGDAVVQMAIQLAFFRDRGFTAPVYESATTRTFQLGRTETIRPLTLAQGAFVEGMDDPSIDLESKARLLEAALRAHLEAAGKSSAGMGVDRHLFSLRIASAQLGLPLPSLFSDPLFQASSDFQLLTSQMVGSWFVGGFAHTNTDGYGCCYYIRPKEITMTVAANRAGELTDVGRFKSQLARAFAELGPLLQAIGAALAKEKTQKAQETNSNSNADVSSGPSSPASPRIV